MESKKRILVVDDEQEITLVLRSGLAKHGYDVRVAGEGEAALELFHAWTPDLVVTDLSMPNMNGLKLCQRLREISNVPIIVLSVKGDEATKVEALDGGADDYVTKPFGMGELLARVRAALRRSPEATEEGTVIEEGDFRIDLETREVHVDGREIRLSPKEFDLLMYLFKNKERVVPRDELLSRVWNYRVDLNLNSRTVDTHVTRLRRKLQKAVGTEAAVIVAVAKIGYRYLGEATTAPA